jgi:hypothetical protein
MVSLKKIVAQIGKCLTKVSKGVAACEKQLAKLTKLLGRRSAKTDCQQLLDIWNAAIQTREDAEGLLEAAQQTLDQARTAEMSAETDYQQNCV